MPIAPTRRKFGVAALGLTIPPLFAQADVPGSRPFPDLKIVREMVGVSHTDVKRVRELVEAHPALANAAIDWGFGDWEDALGAASHTGRREIADVLLAHGARPSIFSAAMLGHLDVVRAFVSARPGMQKTLGPHGISLMAHARAGGSVEVVKYLESVGDADRALPTEPLENSDRDALIGSYSFSPIPGDTFEVDVRNDMRGVAKLGIARSGSSRSFLFHTGDLVFFPSGVPSVKIAFARNNGKVTQLTIADPDVFLTAKRT